MQVQGASNVNPNFGLNFGGRDGTDKNSFSKLDN